jgi:hypothetical protein
MTGRALSLTDEDPCDAQSKLHHRNECVYECLSTSGLDSRPGTQIRRRLSAVRSLVQDCLPNGQPPDYCIIWHLYYRRHALPGLPALGRGRCCSAPHESGAMPYKLAASGGNGISTQIGL